MRDHGTELKLQAFLDGELPPADCESVRALIGREAEARALYEELQTMKALLAGNQIEMTVPATREFYWSRIVRAIEREERAEERLGSSSPSWWLRFLIPAAGVAVLTLTLTVGVHLPGRAGSGFPALTGSHQIETPLEDTPSFTFRSEPEAMTVVWVDSGPN